MTDKYAKLREAADHPGTQYLAEQLQAAYDKVKEWPEYSETGFMDLLTLRNLVPGAIDQLAAEKARADAAEADACREAQLATDKARDLLDAEATIATLTAERDALKRERDEAREAHDGWNPISTCPIREPVDLWCVYGGEEFAQYEGGASIGKLVPNRIKTKEYGFFGNQSNDGVPQRDAPDLVPVAWRKAAPSCPATLIAEALGIPVTLEDARAALSDANAAEREDRNA